MVLLLQRASSVPLHRQIYLALRATIIDAQMAIGARLPSSRVLAADLRVSRTTVLGAYGQLAADGFIVARRGDGSRVSGAVPRSAPTPQVAGLTGRAGGDAAGSPAMLSAFGARMVAVYRPPRGRSELRAVNAPVSFGCPPLAVGIPDLEAFPLAIWSRLANRQWRRNAVELLSPGDGAGYLPLRQAIAEYALINRAARCTAQQVIITAGAQQGISIAARLLLNPGDQVWIEQPGFTPARSAFLGVGAELVDVPVHAEGLDVAIGRTRAPHARMAFVTPSFQAPLGVVMSIRHRLALLDWAAETRSWIIEDDYNGEFRYDGQPLASMQGLEHPGALRVIFLGSFSKTMFPALRLGYAIVPPELAEPFALARLTDDRHSPTIEQATLADFIAEGHFARHVRRMRVLYAERQRVFLDIARRELGDLLRVDPAPAGMRLLGWLPTGISARRVADEAALRNVMVATLSRHRVMAENTDALLLGYVPFAAATARAALCSLGEAIKTVARESRDIATRRLGK